MPAGALHIIIPLQLQRFSEVPDQLGCPFRLLLLKIHYFGLFNAKFQFGDCRNVRYARKSGISKSGTSENLCTGLYQCRPNNVS